MAEELKILHHPPFPELLWTEWGWWEGKTILPCWAGFQSRGAAYGSKDSKAVSNGAALINLTPPDGLQIPSEVQCQAFSFQIEKGDEIVSSVLTALTDYYVKLRPKCAGYYDEETFGRIMPLISSANDFKQLIGLSQIHVHPWLKNGVCYVGLELGCGWDEEHGLGVMLHGARVVEIGSADVSFAWEPKESKS